MQLMYDYLPTPLATRVAMHVNLLPKDKKDPDYQYMLNTLIQFEQIAMTGPFDSSLTAFFGTKLSKKQKDHLKIVYDSSKHWIRAHTLAKLATVLNTGDKDTVAAAKVILETMVLEGELEETEARKLIINISPSAPQA